jgi:hypothetical protein
MKPNFINGLVFNYNEKGIAIDMALSYDNATIVKKRSLGVYNIPASFDIETSSFIYNGEKHACMYCWQFGINGITILGRTWQQFKSLISELSRRLGQNRLMVYVHNLAYEFQFMKHWFVWDKVFAIKRRTPVKAITGNIEFRCSLFLSGYNLDTLGKNLIKYKVRKLVGDLDYKLIRHCNTKLSYKENQYRINDVRVVMAYIQECIEDEGDITKIPLTKTGYVRRHCREMCLYGKGDKKARKSQYMRWRKIMKWLTIEVDEYQQLKRAFQGGFTHANAEYVGKILHNIGSADFTSSYPYVMVCKYFPMGKGKLIPQAELTKEEITRCLGSYCCMFDVEFEELQATQIYEQPLSWSRCYGVTKDTKRQINNGRVVYCEKLITTLTELDYDTMNFFYNWKSCKIFNFRIYPRGYLPKELILSILDFYQGKTSLKGVEGMEVEYAKSKNNLNACYGMAVTDIVREINDYDDEWLPPRNPDMLESIFEYNNKQDRFLFYPWGVWVTAHARHNLFSGIREFKSDYVYSDTDSIKGFNFDKHMDYFNKYNNNVEKEIDKVSEYYNIPREMFAPKTKKGEVKTIGVWDMEGTYSYFKTMGAKRYMTVKGDVIEITIAGLSKINGLKYMCDVAGIKYTVDENNHIHYKSGMLKNLYDLFDETLEIPPAKTGKLTHTYFDQSCKGWLIDYQGKGGVYYEKSYVHLEDAPYSMSLAKEFLDYLKGEIHVFF